MRKGLQGQRFNRFLVIEREGKRGSHPTYLCLCDCGNTRIALAHNLKNGAHKSCGCYEMERKTVHGNCKAEEVTTEYRSWRNMKKRCYYPNDEYYADYGGRGIIICERWRDSFVNFLEDMGEKPSPKHSIDRIDNNGNYSPDNCKWSTSAEQSKNQRVRKDNTSGCKGVSQVKRGKKWHAYIKPDKDSKTKTLGFFVHKADAIAARLEAELLYGFTQQEVIYAL